MFIKVYVFMSFICKLMFLTSMIEKTKRRGALQKHKKYDGDHEQSQTHGSESDEHIRDGRTARR